MKHSKKRQQQKSGHRAAAQPSLRLAVAQSGKGVAFNVEQALQAAVAHHQAGRLQPAEAGYRQILATHPRHPHALHLLGVVAAQTGHYEPAVKLMSEAIAQNANVAAFHSSLGAALRSLGRLEEARICFERSLALQPDFPEAHNNLGNVLAMQGKTEEAVLCFRRALASHPDSAAAHNNLGNALNSVGHSDEAVDCLRQAVALQPTLAEAHNNLGNAFKDLARLDEAVLHYRQAITFSPQMSLFHSNLVYVLYFHSNFDAEKIYDEHRRWAQRYEQPRRVAHIPHANVRDPERRLKIGYVSPDLRDHPVGRGLISLFEHHDHKMFDIICYADTACPDAVTERLRKCADCWYDTVGWTEERLTSQIRQDGVDLLIDLSLHMAGSKLPAFARKPAPVQVTFAGYPGTTGLDAIDYRLTDSYLDPHDSETGVYSEKSIRLPHSWWCYTPSENDPTINSLPAQSVGHITFGCLNTIGKVNDHVLKLWAAVLNTVPSSRLLLLARPGSYQNWVLEIMKASGIGSERIRFAERCPHLQYLALHHQIDISLDTFPYNGHTTSLDSLWMGVPVISLVGQTVVGRGGVSILSNIGLPDLIARSEEEYVQIAASLTSDLPRLADLRVGLREKMLASPLMDAVSYAQAIEGAYRQMWRNWCAGSAQSDPPIFSNTAKQNAVVANSTLQESSRYADRVNQIVETPIEENGQSVEQSLQAALVHHHAGRLGPAEAGYRQILAAHPRHPQTLNLLGVLAIQTSRHAAAVELIKQAITEKADVSEFHSNLGEALRVLGRQDEAITAYRRALALQPGLVDAHNNLGVLLEGAHQIDEAVSCFRRALELQPDNAVAHYNLGNAIAAQGALDDAERSYGFALKLQPHLAAAHRNLASVLSRQGRAEEAVARLRQAVALAPEDPAFQSSLLFTLHSHPQAEPAQLLAEHRAWAERHETPRVHFRRSHANTPDPDRSLRIGYVSPDLRDHPVFRFLLPLFQHHDHNCFEITCYADVPRPDAATASLRTQTNHWHTTAGWPEERLAEQIRADGIDILVDLALHTADNRLPVFARKPAPVQVSWLGLPGTTGLEAIDYRLTDPYLDPPGTDSDYSETSVRLPHSVWCYAAPEDGPDVNPLPARSAGHVTFGSLNKFGKVNAQVLALWADVLQAVPGSRLMLLAEAGRHCRWALDVLQAGGVAGDRVEFMPPRGHLAHLALHAGIDIGLDTFPYNGHTATCSALWMGVPVVSLIGRTGVGRGGVSILSNVGLPKLIARSEEAYVRIAADLARDLPRLADLRAGLRERMLSSPLMDGPRFAADVEASYRTMWRTWCATYAADRSSVSA